MDENSMSDGDAKKDQFEEEKREKLSPQTGGKKLKLNDGGSKDSFKDLATDNKEKDDNVDSGVSADKSESTSSDDRGTSSNYVQEGPSNVVIEAAPSSSNVHAILLNIKRPKKGNRNYRKRKTPDRDTDSDSSRDSDDVSPADEDAEPQTIQREPLDSSDDNQGSFLGFLSQLADSDSSPSLDFDTDENIEDDYESDIILQTNSNDSSEEERYTPLDDNDTEPGESQERRTRMSSVLKKPRPKHNWFALREIINREMGLSYPFGMTTKNDVSFERRFYGSLHAVYRMNKLHKLNKHKGCVNSINFHPEGHLLVSGSDDTNIIIWDWARNKALQTIRTGHRSNVFQSKFLPLNSSSQLNIATCARDGQVKLLQCPPSGGPAIKYKLMSHSRAAYKLHVSPSEPHVVVSAGEDGVVMQADVRADVVRRLFTVKSGSLPVPLYSVHGHPFNNTQLLVAGKDMYVRVYDKRFVTKPAAMYCPGTFQDKFENRKKKRNYMMHLTCAVYNHDGTEILGSYNDEDIYLFDTVSDQFDENSTKQGYTHKYAGHRNSATFKGVAFFGPKSQYIVSGSDCSYIYIWDKNTESIVQWLHGDIGGVVNCIEAHPKCPVIASSGLDKDVKIWVPTLNEDPEYKGLERAVKDNSVTQLRPLFNDFLPTLYSAWRSERLHTDQNTDPRRHNSNIEFDGNVCTTF